MFALQDVGRFLRRHRRAVVIGGIAGVVIGGIVRARRAIDDAMAELADADNLRLRTSQRHLHLARVSRESDEALLRFVASLEAALESKFSGIPACVAAIKDMRSRRPTAPHMAPTSPSDAVSAPTPSHADQEKELWDELKVATFTKLAVALLMMTLLQLTLMTQLHILGRHNFLNFKATAEEPGLTMAVRGSFLSLTYTHMLGDGLNQLADAVKPVVRRVLSGCTLTTKLDCDATASLLRRVCDGVDSSASPAADGARGREEATTPLARFVVAPSQHLQGASPAAQAMLDETWDIVESPAFAAALTAALDRSLGVLKDQLAISVFRGGPGLAQSPALTSPGPPSSAQQAVVLVSKPLPSVLVQLKPSKTVLAVEGQRSVHADATVNLPEVQALMSAVFDSVPGDLGALDS